MRHVSHLQLKSDVLKSHKNVWNAFSETFFRCLKSYCHTSAAVVVFVVAVAASVVVNTVTEGNAFNDYLKVRLPLPISQSIIACFGTQNNLGQSMRLPREDGIFYFNRIVLLWLLCFSVRKSIVLLSENHSKGIESRISRGLEKFLKAFHWKF